MFSSVDTEMAKGDYASACYYFSQRQQSNIAAGARKAGLNVNVVRRRAHRADQGDRDHARPARADVRRREPRRSSSSVVVHGNQATVTFTDSISGHPYTETDALVREDGQWKADRILKRTNTG